MAADVVERRPATVTGTLYDTGRGYPALVRMDVPEGGGPVRGWLLGFPDERAATVLDRLDEIEGPSYGRTDVVTADGTAAVTYAFLGEPDGFVTIADGAWDREDER